MKNKMKQINRKFVLVGDGFCGKSTLIAAFYNRKFIHKYEPTIFDTFTLNTEIHKRHVNLELWDTAGQEEFSRVRPLSYPEVDAVIICFSIDSRESLSNVSETWIPEIRHFCSNKVPIVLVATKIDLRLTTSTIGPKSILLQQEHFVCLNKNSNKNSLTQTNLINQINCGSVKTLALYCCRHRRPCTCYHSRICATDCLNNVKNDQKLLKHNQKISNSSNCILSCDSSTLSRRTCIVNKEESLNARNSSNINESLSSLEDAEEISMSSCSLNQEVISNNCNNSIYRHNRDMYNTLIYLQQTSFDTCDYKQLNENNSILKKAAQENSNYEKLNKVDDDYEHKFVHLNDLSLNSKNEYAKLNEFILDNNNNKNKAKTNSMSSLSKKYHSLTKLKNINFFNNINLKHRFNNVLLNNHLNVSLKNKNNLKQLNYTNKKLSTSSTSLPYSLTFNTNSNKDLKTLNLDEKNYFTSHLITTEEGLKLCTKVGASAYIECSSKLDINVEKVFQTALKISIKNPICMKMDICSIS